MAHTGSSRLPFMMAVTFLRVVYETGVRIWSVLVEGEMDLIMASPWQV